MASKVEGGINLISKIAPAVESTGLKLFEAGSVAVSTAAKPIGYGLGAVAGLTLTGYGLQQGAVQTRKGVEYLLTGEMPVDTSTRQDATPYYTGTGTGFMVSAPATQSNPVSSTQQGEIDLTGLAIIAAIALVGWYLLKGRR